MPVLHPAEIWKRSGRYDIDVVFQLRDRAERELVLAITHEEIVALHASQTIRSYRDLPQIWYHIQIKERDEPRAPGGVLRTREFTMKDSYTLDRDQAGLDEGYAKHEEAYDRIYRRCGLTFYKVESDTGLMGGSMAHEYMAPSSAGEDRVARCSGCDYAANVEMAVSRIDRAALAAQRAGGRGRDARRDDDRRAGAASSGVDAAHDRARRCRSWPTTASVWLALVRGDRRLHELKLRQGAASRARAPPRPRRSRPRSARSPARSARSASAAARSAASWPTRRCARARGSPAPTARAGISPASRPARDYEADLRRPARGRGRRRLPALRRRADDRADDRDRQHLQARHAVRGRRWARPTWTSWAPSSRSGWAATASGPARIAAAAIEQSFDEHGCIWPAPIAPFDVWMVAIGNEAPGHADRLADELGTRGLTCMVDDREGSPGVRFADADLIGAPAARDGRQAHRQRRHGRRAPPTHGRVRDGAVGGGSGAHRGPPRQPDAERPCETEPVSATQHSSVAIDATTCGAPAAPDAADPPLRGADGGAVHPRAHRRLLPPRDRRGGGERRRDRRRWSPATTCSRATATTARRWPSAPSRTASWPSCSARPPASPGGYGGSMHLLDVERHFLGGWGIVGGQLPIAVGVGARARLREQAERGAVPARRRRDQHRRLPRVAQPGRDLAPADRLPGHQQPLRHGHVGRDGLGRARAVEARRGLPHARRARRRQRPAGGARGRRPPAAPRARRARSRRCSRRRPTASAGTRWPTRARSTARPRRSPRREARSDRPLRGAAWASTPRAVARLRSEVNAEIDAAIRQAAADPAPDPAGLFDNVYGDPDWREQFSRMAARRAVRRAGGDARMADVTYREALRRALDEELARDDTRLPHGRGDRALRGLLQGHGGPLGEVRPAARARDADRRGGLRRRRHRRRDARPAAGRRDHDDQLHPGGHGHGREPRGQGSPDVRRQGRRADGDPHARPAPARS